MRQLSSSISFSRALGYGSLVSARQRPALLVLARTQSSSTSDVGPRSKGSASSNPHKKPPQSLVYNQARWANTSQGFRAPSRVAGDTGCVAANQHSLARPTASVYDDSEHLPSLPVPELGQTLDRLKQSVSPVVMNSAEFVNTLKLIDRFSRSAGPKLDLLLRAKAAQTKNWLTRDWWQHEVYLKSRQPLVINSNPAMNYPAFPFEVNTQRALINTIAQLVSGVIDFKLSLDQGYNPEATSAQNEFRLETNLCYNQYQGLFGSTRIPGHQLDTREASHFGVDQCTNSFSLIVSFRGRFYELQIGEVENENNRVEKLAIVLDKIVALHQDTVELADNSTTEGPGVLTAARREDWAKAYKLLDANSMEAIQAAQFILCIDTLPEEPQQFASNLLKQPQGSPSNLAALGRQILHADEANIGNRWFDKCFQLVVVADHKAERLLGAGINYEHSFGEGTMITRLIEHSYDKTVDMNRQLKAAASANYYGQQRVDKGSLNATSGNTLSSFRQLKMIDYDHHNNHEELEHCIKRARQDYLSQVNQFDLSYLNYPNYGSNAIKSWHFSPDSWFQVALQLGYYNLHKRLGPCYESASARRFAYGRTETIRSLNKEVAQFCLEPHYDTLQAAIKAHKKYAISAGNADAIDRVLMGYRLTFRELKTNAWKWGIPTLATDAESAKQPEADNQQTTFQLEQLFTEDELAVISAFFNSELIKRSQRFALSTSQVSSVHPNIYMCYGPLLADGYGCCYNITGQQIVAAITANSSNQSFSCDVHDMNESVQNSLDNMREIVENHH